MADVTVGDLMLALGERDVEIIALKKDLATLRAQLATHEQPDELAARRAATAAPDEEPAS